MKVALPIMKEDVADLLINDEEVVCVDIRNKYNVRSVNDMTYATAKYFINDKNTAFYHVIERGNDNEYNTPIKKKRKHA